MSQYAASEGSGAVVEAEISGRDVLVQYVVLRRDLIDEWPLGSVVTQGCHASVCAIWLSKDDAHTAEYCSAGNIDSMHKVTLEVKGETQIVNLSEKRKTGGIDHKLWIEQPENTPTCLATKPYPKSTVSSYFKKLKLCKLLKVRSCRPKPSSSDGHGFAGALRPLQTLLKFFRGNGTIQYIQIATPNDFPIVFMIFCVLFFKLKSESTNEML